MDSAFDDNTTTVSHELARKGARQLDALYPRMAALVKNQRIVESIESFNLATNYAREVDLSEPLRVREVGQNTADLIGFLKAGQIDDAIANIR